MLQTLKIQKFMLKEQYYYTTQNYKASLTIRPILWGYLGQRKKDLKEQPLLWGGLHWDLWKKKSLEDWRSWYHIWLHQSQMMSEWQPWFWQVLMNYLKRWSQKHHSFGHFSKPWCSIQNHENQGGRTSRRCAVILSWFNLQEKNKDRKSVV